MSAFSPNVRAFRTPMFSLGSLPVYLTTLLLALHILCLLGSIFAGEDAWREALAYFPGAPAQKYQFWRLITCVFVHDASLFWFLLHMIFLYQFGMLLEMRYGRRVLAALYISTAMLWPAVHGISWAAFSFAETRIFGTAVPHLCLLAGVAITWPNLPVFFPKLRLKWIALAFLAAQLAVFVRTNDYPSAAALALGVGVTWLLLRWAQRMPEEFVGGRSMSGRQRKTQRAVRGRSSPPPPAAEYEAKIRPRLELDEEHPVVVEIDTLLEKISRHGMASLTEEEKAVLQKASQDLQRKDAKS